MKNLIKDLLQIIKEEVTVHQQIIAVLKHERKSLVGLVVEEIYATSTEKELLSLKIKSLEEAREAILEKISSQKGINKRTLTISHLATLIDEPESSQLLSLKDILLNLINEVILLNNENGLYLENSVRLVGETIEFLRQYFSGKVGENYCRPKAKAQSTSVHNGAIISRQI